MAQHTCEAIVVTCIDFRFQKFIDDWVQKNVGTRNHDRVAFAGGVKDLESIMNQIAISKRLHDIQKVVLINHEDCGAYGETGTAQKHAEDLRNAAQKIQETVPGIGVELYFVLLDGTFEKIA